MKKIVLLTFFCGFIVLLTGCGTTITPGQVPQVSALSSSFRADVRNPVIIPECTVGEIITGEANYGSVLGFIPTGEVAPWNAEDYAIYNACIKANADFIVSPLVVHKRNDYILWSSNTVIVTGRAGRYTVFKTMSAGK